MEGTTYLLPAEPITNLDAYLASGGGEGLERARTLGPERVASEVREAGLRGRGGAGFPTGIKWQGLQRDPSPVKYMVANGAEGEPGTFKDRTLMRTNPYQIVEGLAIATLAVGAAGAYLGVKRSFGHEIDRLTRAIAEMEAAGLLDVPITLSPGPDDYLFGEEKGLLEVIEGNDPLPRLYPPYVRGLFADTENSNPAVVNNVETLANVPHILRNGAGWFRGSGTERSPGTMVFTICGDVRTETVVELPLGTPLSFLIYGPGGGTREDRRPKAVFSGVSNRPLTHDQLDLPLDYDALARVGGGLGSGGFIVYDDTACIVAVAALYSRFLWVSSCGQCPSCKLGTEQLTVLFDRIEAGQAGLEELEEAAAWTRRVTESNRCGLGQAQHNAAAGIIEKYWDELVAHLGSSCPRPRQLRLPKLLEHDAPNGRFVYDEEFLTRTGG